MSQAGFPMCPLQKLKVLFAVGCDGEVSEPLEVNALNCDTVEQLKEKILASFKNKFGFPYCTPIRELFVGELKGLGQWVFDLWLSAPIN